MNSKFTTRLRGMFAGQMTEGEIRFCDSLNRLAQDTLDRRVFFSIFVVVLHQDLDALRRHEFDVDAALASGFQPKIETAVRSQSANSKFQASEPEVEFLKDLQGLIDYASRNGLGFGLITSILTHDIGEIVDNEMSLEKAKARGVLPQSAGWAQQNAELVGEGEPDA